MQKKLVRKSTSLSLPKLFIILGLIIVAIETGHVLFAQQKAWAATDSCTPPATTYGTDTMTAPVPETATYAIWTRIKIPSSSANSILLSIDNNSSCYNVGGSSSIPTNTWEWVEYNDGNTANVIQLPLGQGNHTLKLIATSQNVVVDRIEIVADPSCVPSGTGNNCASTSVQTSSSGSGSSSNSGSTSTNKSSGSSKNNVTALVTTKDGTTIVIPTTTSKSLQVTAPVTFEPAATDQPIKKVQYYLNKKLLATVSTSPYSYHLNSKDILNGTYTLTTKTYYITGAINDTAQKLIIKNPYSLTQFRLQVQHYALWEVITLILLIVAIYYLFRNRFAPITKRLEIKQSGTYAEAVVVPELKAFISPELSTSDTTIKSATGDSPTTNDSNNPRL
jgi:hypothetical protein